MREDSFLILSQMAGGIICLYIKPEKNKIEKYRMAIKTWDGWLNRDSMIDNEAAILSIFKSDNKKSVDERNNNPANKSVISQLVYLGREVIAHINIKIANGISLLNLFSQMAASVFLMTRKLVKNDCANMVIHKDQLRLVARIKKVYPMGRMAGLRANI